MNGSVVRTSSSRRHTRNNTASPYSRPTAKKPTSQGWSFTGFLSFLNPLRTRSSPAGEDVPAVGGEAPSPQAVRGQEALSEGLSKADVFYPSHVLQQQQPPQSQSPDQFVSKPPTSPVMNGDHRTSPHSDESQASSSENLKKVQQFLDEKAGRPLNHIELAGLVHLLQNSVEDDDERPEPFRFSKSPSTPARGTTPVNFISPSTSEQLVSAAGTAAQNARKTLKKNPMGVYRWQGGGSARVRNRYQSPGFGSTGPRSTIKLVPEKLKTDTKRRRVGEVATSSSPQKAGATPASTANSAAASGISTSVSAPAALNGISSSNGRTNGASGTAPPTTPRLRTNGIKPTAPVVPSPLRQTWSQSDSPPQASPPYPVSKPTRAACFMTELIKEVTPPKKPDFANPYEAANSMIKPAPKKQPGRRTRSAVKAESTAPKEPELTPQAIIEATVPKGSKRSRPPPELIGAKAPEKRILSPPESSAPRRSTRLNGAEPTTNGINGTTTYKPAALEEVPDEERPSPPKKQRTVKSSPVTSRRMPAVTVEEIDDVDMSTTSSRPDPPPPHTLPSEVVEPVDDKPDKKRSTSPTSSFPNFGLPRPGFNSTKSSAPKAPSKLRFSINAEKDDKMDTTPLPALPESAPTCASTPASSASETLRSVPIAAKRPEGPRALVLAMRKEELPKYTFTFPTSSPGAGPSTLRARQAAKVGPASSLPTYDFSKDPVPAPKPTTSFDWKAAGMKAPSKPTSDTWKCSVCMLDSPGTADKCSVCDEPRPNKPKPAPVQGFNWAAVGAKPPVKPTGQWTCLTCMLSNPNSVVKCTVCDAAR